MTVHRRGHVGMALLAYAPVGFILLRERQIGLALLGLLGVLVVEPLPDSDFWLPGLSHRGTSHSLLAALVVGGMIGALGWVIGNRVTVLLANALTGLDTSTVGIFAGLFQWTAKQLRFLDGGTLATFGFAIGAFGVFVHLLADAITVAGIRPLLPLSRWQLSLSSLRADSPLANNVLLGLGVLVLASVFLATAPGVGLVGAPAGLSPVDVAAGQSQNASGPTVAFNNQTTNGSIVTIERATLPEGGFIVLSNDPYGEIGLLEESMIAVSKPLGPGTHRNITLHVRHSPPGGFLNTSALDTTSDYSVGLYRDTNNNSQFDFITASGTTDQPYTVGEGTDQRLAADSAVITIPGSNTPRPTASVRFANQTTNRSAVTVRSVTLPRGGWVVVHNESYLRGGDPLSSTVGISRYLSAGTHRNVSVALLNESVQRDQTLVAIPGQDTNGNQQYDYVRSEGFRDVPYTDEGGVITDTAQVHVTGGPRTTAATTATTTTTSVTPPAERTVETGNASGSQGEGGWLPDSPLAIAALVLALAVVVVTFVRRRP
jgi:membrane-bound metal-dependent hydrolase YbcI (DUF457 family)